MANATASSSGVFQRQAVGVGTCTDKEAGRRSEELFSVHIAERRERRGLQAPPNAVRTASVRLHQNEAEEATVGESACLA